MREDTSLRDIISCVISDLKEFNEKEEKEIEENLPKWTFDFEKSVTKLFKDDEKKAKSFMHLADYHNSLHSSNFSVDGSNNGHSNNRRVNREYQEENGGSYCESVSTTRKKQNTNKASNVKVTNFNVNNEMNNIEASKAKEIKNNSAQLLGCKRKNEEEENSTCNGNNKLIIPISRTITKSKNANKGKSIKSQSTFQHSAEAAIDSEGTDKSSFPICIILAKKDSSAENPFSSTLKIYFRSTCSLDVIVKYVKCKMGNDIQVKFYLNSSEKELLPELTLEEVQRKWMQLFPESEQVILRYQLEDLKEEAVNEE
eukprot:CAMPEP_0170523918 /NCGR_PEP_ID=MMETSP0209-20121228/9371_1 /TAXON_ID=665100 ORGANISM="Litonotus pictus, Strain P1" /NCGR_SAMPLE_ID=MMETSP0209 /ASSEMBLY_ACC=CAM_ASM_000301 /LENGTH=312 /DNA_ID=CAMNT_0010812319 /DNA_START=304 /DNA_END=1242 /DNA_ORIENTATION=+